jgi:hypothetical protein
VHCAVVVALQAIPDPHSSARTRKVFSTGSQGWLAHALIVTAPDIAIALNLLWIEWNRGDLLRIS